MKPSQRTDIMPPEVLTHFWEAALSRCCGGKATQGLVENKSIFVIDSNITWQPVPRSEFTKFDFLGWCDSLLLRCGILNELVTPTGEREREMNGGSEGISHSQSFWGGTGQDERQKISQLESQNPQQIVWVFLLVSMIADNHGWIFGSASRLWLTRRSCQCDCQSITAVCDTCTVGRSDHCGRN